MSGLSGGDAANLRPVVMVVDDDPQMRELMAEMLATFGYEALLADGATTALLSLLLQPKLVCAVIDVEMPNGNGAELASQVKGRAPELPIIMMSALTLEEIIPFVRGLTVAGILCKPFRLRDLRMAITDAVARAAAVHGPSPAPVPPEPGVQR